MLFKTAKVLNLKQKAHLALLGANFIFAANYSIVKSITPALIGSYGLNVARVLVSTSLFWISYGLKPGEPGIKKKDMGRLIICAITGVALNQILFIKGLSLTSTVHASLLSLGTPIFITFIAAWLLKEPLGVFKIAGLFLGVSGAFMLIASKEGGQTGNNVLLGDTFVIINAISYAFYMVLVRPLMKEYSPVHVLRWMFTIGTFLILPFGIGQFASTPWHLFTVVDWFSIGFVTVGATFTAYLLNMYGLRHIGASAAGSYVYSQPVFAALIAFLFIGEALTTLKIASAILIFAGVYLVNVNRSVAPITKTER